MAYTTTLFVHDLASSAPRCSQFNVECYSDIGLTTLVSSGTSPVIYRNGMWHQTTGIFLTGLTAGATYYIRWGVVAPVSGLIGWSTAQSVVAPNPPAPTVSFSATYNPVSSGVTYTITPIGPSSDIDHYEAYWNFTNTAPTTQAPLAKIVDATLTTAFTFFAGATPSTII